MVSVKLRLAVNPLVLAGVCGYFRYSLTCPTVVHCTTMVQCNLIHNRPGVTNRLST